MPNNGWMTTTMWLCLKINSTPKTYWLIIILIMAL